jgi:hypothetical protein
MTFEDVEVGAADPAGPDFDQGRFRRHLGPVDFLDYWIGAGSGEGGDSNLFHGSILFARGFSTGLIAAA